MIRWRCSNHLAALALGCLSTLVTGCSTAQDLGGALVAPQKPVQAQVAQGFRHQITSEQPARLMVIGDSLSQGFAQALQQRAAERKLALTVANRGRVSTGLARTDFHDWPIDFAVLAAAEQPDIVVAHFGANDMQGVTRPDNRAAYGTPEWDLAYRAEARRILTTAAENGAVFMWLGPAPDGNSGLGKHMKYIAPLFKLEAEASGAIYLPLADFTADADGNFATAIAINGVSTTIRTGDGSHFNLTGYRLVADHILDELLRRYPVLEPSADMIATLQ